MDTQKIDCLNTEFENIGGIDSLMCVLGLSFPESATPFQKAGLTLSHLMFVVKESILNGREVTDNLCTAIKLLADIVYDGREQQK